MPFKNLRSLFLFAFICLLCYGNAVRYRMTRDLGLAMSIIDQEYVEPADSKRLYEAAMAGMMRSLDPHSSYIAAQKLPSFQSVFEQQFGGLGVSLDGPPRRPQLTVMTTLFNSPAFKAGLRPGDIIARVDGEDVMTWPVEKVSDILRGKEGTSVQLKIDRQGELFEKTIVRGRIDVESVIGDRRRGDGSWEFLMQADPRVAYLRIELFGEKTAAELQKAIESCDPPPEALIIDLRDNSGGLLIAATQICDMFLDDGQIVTTRGRNDRVDEEVKAKIGTIVPNNVPIAILINEHSASASEVVAACLKDRKRAIVVGKRSFGKGSVQNVIPLEGGRAAMRLTTAYYYPPSGRRIHRRDLTSEEGSWGVDPTEDCEIGLTAEQLTAAVQRFRSRSDPISNGMIPAQAPADESTQTSDKKDGGAIREANPDASLPEDAQLWLALQRLQEKLDQ
ncbi:MAG: S41 family peptidase [Planctomycetota bacterium]